VGRRFKSVVDDWEYVIFELLATGVICSDLHVLKKYHKSRFLEAISLLLRRFRVCSCSSQEYLSQLRYHFLGEGSFAGWKHSNDLEDILEYQSEEFPIFHLLKQSR